MPELIPAEPGSPEWLAARRAGVTATDIVTILGLSRWDSVYSLFWRKLGQVPDVPDSDRFRLGRALERYACTRWCEDRGIDPIEGPVTGGLRRNSIRKWQLATPDGLYHNEPVELKSWADAGRHAWDDGPPPAVRAQVLWQMDVMDMGTGHVGVVFLPSGEFRSYVVRHGCGPNRSIADNESCDICADQALMRAAGEEFMGRLRLELPPPDPDSSAATLAAVRTRFTRQPAKQAEVDAELFERWSAARNGLRTYEQIAQTLEIQLREQAGEAAEYTVDGQLVARRVISNAQVKAHVRHQDYIRRVKQGDDDE